ncbi:putative membrane protein YeaQ/YmgE (transglycosylase-associated protein family) [Hoeflea marina]|uniref:Putative membrane protein YeaQ/YmgE (Transglycosylase-associated protein family) n=1 Tax=Hoeflea marina TaxID=274592 RepID=A0A317PQY8_9HYPH|nr:GlsB/YeaQ/YmgE family stress response membrane protein [Hoeflea marina]PWW03901.1 putative membrane protein YeaQ/YmgE (transglycosylase-associated protein family) [Hoeflea marina]
MDLNGVGFLGAIIVGGVAGWLAERFMRSNMGLLMNIILGIVGAALLNFLLGVLGIYTGTGLLVYLIVGFVGACILIALARAIRR